MIKTESGMEMKKGRASKRESERNSSCFGQEGSDGGTCQKSCVGCLPGRDASDAELRRTGRGQIADRRQQIRLGLAAAEQQAANTNNGLTAGQRAALTRSVDSYSEENVANGVTVGMGTLRDGEAASTNFERDSAGRPTALGVDDNGVKFARVRVTFRNADIDERTVLHEGSHVADRQEFII